jgi:DNA processing protein
MPTEHARALLTIMQLPGVGQARGRDVARTAIARRTGIWDVAVVKIDAAGPKREAADRDADRVLRECEQYDIDVLALGDAAYPTRLAEIADAPPLLYVKGAVKALDATAIAVVGTRNASTVGLRAAEIIGESLARRGLAVVSGLALGIDAAAHTGALNAGGITIAVLAHGLDTVSPKTNKPIADRLLATGGALVSEHPPGVPARPAEFVRRNRIQSGMSVCSVVVESGAEGGAMHQAAFTVEQKRPLFTVLSNSETADLNEAGARKLVIQFKATPVRSTGELTKAVDRLLTYSATSVPRQGQNDLKW